MRVEFCKSIDVESEVNITTEDITSTLREEMDLAKKSEHNRTVLSFINDVYSCPSSDR